MKSNSYTHIFLIHIYFKGTLIDFSNMKMSPNLLSFTIMFCSYRLSRWIAIMWETNFLTHPLIMLEKPKAIFSKVTFRTLVLKYILI